MGCQEAPVLEKFRPGLYPRHLWPALLVIGLIGLIGLVLMMVVIK